MPEGEPNPRVDDAVDRELQPWVVVRAPTGDEARAKRAVVAGPQQPVVGDEIVRAIGPVGHHDRYGVAGVLLEAGSDGEAKAVAVRRANAPYARVGRGQACDRTDGVVDAAVVHNQDLVVDRLAYQGIGDADDGVADRRLLVVRRDDDREL